MKTTALFLTALLATTGAFANDAADEQNLTLAAADLKVKSTWVETEEDAQLRLNETLTEKAADLTAEVNAKLEKELEAKLAAKLGL